MSSNPSIDGIRNCGWSRLLLLAVIAWTLPWLGRSAHAEDRVAPAEKKSDEVDDWQIILMNGQKVGYAHSMTRTEDRDGKPVTVTEVFTHLTIKRFGGSLTSDVNQRTEEDADGRMLSFYLLQDNKPFSKTEARGQVQGDTLSVETTSSGKSFQKEITLTPDVKSATWFERSLKESPLKVGESRTFKTFEPSLSKITDITVKQLEPGETKLLSGEVVELDRTEMTQSILPGVTTMVYSNAAGETKKMTVSLLGMETYSCTSEEALKEITAASIDLGMDTLVKIGAIDRPFETRKVTYRIEPTDYDPRKVFQETSLQRVQPGDKGGFLIEVTAVDAGTPGDEPAPDAKYLSSSRFIDLSDPLIVKLADEMAGGETDPTKIAILAESYVHKHLKLKNFSTAMATASEVAASQSGDCTEHGILLAALLRVKQIPSRVVTGLVYAPSLKGFGGHMWTEAYLKGRWVPLDGTLAKGHGDAIHLKTGDSALEDSAALPVESFLPLIHVIGRTKIAVEKAEYAE